MITQLADFLLKTVCSFWIGLFLFRFYCYLIKFNLSLLGGNLDQFVFKATDWAVLPLRRILPRSGNFDSASLLCAFIFQYLLVLFQTLLLTGHFPGSVAIAISLFELISTVISSLTVVIIIYALMSWVAAREEIKYFLDILVSPILTPIRRITPQFAGFDLSVLVSLIFLQLLNIILVNIKVLILF